MIDDKYWRALGAFVAGFTLCLLLTRLFVTNDATIGTWFAAIAIPMGLGRALRA